MKIEEIQNRRTAALEFNELGEGYTPLESFYEAVLRDIMQNGAAVDQQKAKAALGKT